MRSKDNSHKTKGESIKHIKQQISKIDCRIVMINADIDQKIRSIDEDEMNLIRVKFCKKNLLQQLKEIGRE